MSQDPLLKIEGVAKLYGWHVEEQPVAGEMRVFKIHCGDDWLQDWFEVFLLHNMVGWRMFTEVRYATFEVFTEKTLPAILSGLSG